MIATLCPKNQEAAKEQSYWPIRLCSFSISLREKKQNCLTAKGAVRRQSIWGYRALGGALPY
jgi:hypothetical protein